MQDLNGKKNNKIQKVKQMKQVAEFLNKISGFLKMNKNNLLKKMKAILIKDHLRLNI